MKDIKPKKFTKTFPINLDIATHKTLKMMAIESDMTLHAFIINILISTAAEYRPEHILASKDGINRSTQE